MEIGRYRQCLASDFAELRAAAATVDLRRPVPTCPGWSMSDLVSHVAEVYLHKVESMRRGELPQPWPPERPPIPPAVLLDDAYAQLSSEFDARPPSEVTAHWYGPDPTVGCLIRRMAQETVIHRIDAQRAAGGAVTPIPADLALDGVDEVLRVVLGFLSRTWPEAFNDLPTSGESAPVRVLASETSWLLTATPKGVLVTDDVTSHAAATVTGDAGSVLLWLWGRVDDTAVVASGAEVSLSQLRGLLHEATQ